MPKAIVLVLISDLSLIVLGFFAREIVCPQTPTIYCDRTYLHQLWWLMFIIDSISPATLPSTHTRTHTAHTHPLRLITRRKSACDKTVRLDFIFAFSCANAVICVQFICTRASYTQLYGLIWVRAEWRCLKSPRKSGSPLHRCVSLINYGCLPFEGHF